MCAVDRNAGGLHPNGVDSWRFVSTFARTPQRLQRIAQYSRMPQPRINLDEQHNVSLASGHRATAPPLSTDLANRSVVYPRYLHVLPLCKLLGCN